LVVTGYLFGTLLDCYIILDRIAIFERKVNAFFKFSALKMAAIALSVSIAIQFPWYFEFVPTSNTESLDTGVEYQIWYLGLSNYALTQTGQVILLIVYGIRDIATMVIVIILNIVSIFYFKSYLNTKASLLCEPRPANYSNALSVSGLAQHSLRRMKFWQGKIEVTIAQPVRELSVECAMISKAEQKATTMCITMCVLTILDHLIHITCNVFPIFSASNFKFVLYWAASMFFVFKHSLNFVLFIAFNKVFKNVCSKMFNL
jgi:hypothetical protein